MNWEPWSAYELSAWTQAWIDGFVGFFAIASAAAALVLLAALLFGVRAVETVVRRRFWCRDAGRDVEVEFRSPARAARPVQVVSCTAFEPATAVACRRACLDPSARERRPPPPAAWAGGGAAHTDRSWSG
jgi:hypothetical protein